MLRNTLFALMTLATAPACAASLHPAVQMHIDEARSMCEEMKGTFTFDQKAGLHVADLNGDGRDDYVISSAAFNCEGAASLYGGSSGHTHYIVTSQPGGDDSLYATEESIVTAYGFTIDDSQKPAAIIFESRCPGMDGTHIGKARWEWQDGKMIATSIAEGCKD